MLVYILLMGEICVMWAGRHWALAFSPPLSISVALTILFLYQIQKAKKRKYPGPFPSPAVTFVVGGA